MTRLNLFYFLLLIGLSVSGFFFARSNRFIKSRYTTKATLLLGALLIIVVSVFLRQQAHLEFQLIPDWFALPFEIIWYTPFAVFFFAGASRLIASEFAARGLLVLSGLVFISGLGHASGAVIPVDLDPKRFKMTEDGVCIQSTGYTCGAAGAVTLLNRWGIKCNEWEMAQLSHTTKWGVSLPSLARGISQKVKDKGLEVKMIRLDWEGLQRLGLPCIISTKFWFLLVDHVVVVLRVEPDGVLIGDPLRGTTKWSQEEFLNKWRGKIVLLIEPTE